MSSVVVPELQYGQKKLRTHFSFEAMMEVLAPSLCKPEPIQPCRIAVPAWFDIPPEELKLLTHTFTVRELRTFEKEVVADIMRRKVHRDAR